MNKLYLFFCRVKQYIVKNKGIFALFLIGGMLNTVMVLYCYGNLMPTIANRDEGAYRYYKLSFRDTPAEKTSVEELLTHPLLESCRLINKEKVGTCVGDYPLRRIKGTMQFTEPYQMLIPMDSDALLGGRKEYKDIRFQIIGVTSAEYDLIPYDTFVELGGLDSIGIIEVRITEEQDPKNDAFEKDLLRLFPNTANLYNSLTHTAMYNTAADETALKRIVGTAVISVIAYAFLLHYIVSSRVRENAVFTVLGAGRRRLAGYIFTEAFFLCCLTCLSGILAHILLYEPIFRGLNITESLRYTFMDYCNVFLLMGGLSLLAAIPVTLRAVLSTPASARRRVS